MVTVCQNCGDRGFDNALIFCHECEVYALHRYCLDVLPATFDEYVVWLCEDCESKTLNLPLTNKFRPSQVRENETESFASVKVKKRKNSEKKLKKKSKRKANTHSVTESVVQIHGESSSLALQKVACSENCEKDQEFVRQDGLNGCNFDEAVESLRGKDSQMDLDEFESAEMNCGKNGVKDEKHSTEHPSGEGNLPTESKYIETKTSLAIVPLKISCSANGESNQKPTRQNIPDDDFFYEDAKRLNDLNNNNIHEGGSSSRINDTQVFRCDVHPLAVDQSMSVVEDLKLGKLKDFDEGAYGKKAKSENRQLVICDTQYNSGQSNAVRAQPIIDHIWKGSFSISDKDFGTIGLVAHLSNLAGSNVYAEAKSLPMLLSPEILPRSTVWPKSFLKKGPSDENIALFFFPDSDRNEKIYDSLVNDMICKHRAIRAALQNAELLIFTSTMLPIDFWRFKAKFFLWGVFKGKQPPCEAGEEKNLMKTVNCDRLKSPVSPLSNGSYGCGSMCSTVCSSTL